MPGEKRTGQVSLSPLYRTEPAIHTQEWPTFLGDSALPSEGASRRRSEAPAEGHHGVVPQDELREPIARHDLDTLDQVLGG